jgi:hypothetical protein
VSDAESQFDLSRLLQALWDDKRKLIDRFVVNLCVEQDIRSKKDLRAKEQEQIAATKRGRSNRVC